MTWKIKEAVFQLQTCVFILFEPESNLISRYVATLSNHPFGCNATIFVELSISGTRPDSTIVNDSLWIQPQRPHLAKVSKTKLCNLAYIEPTYNDPPFFSTPMERNNRPSYRTTAIQQSRTMPESRLDKEKAKAKRWIATTTIGVSGVGPTFGRLRESNCPRCAEGRRRASFRLDFVLTAWCLFWQARSQWPTNDGSDLNGGRNGDWKRVPTLSQTLHVRGRCLSILLATQQAPTRDVEIPCEFKGPDVDRRTSFFFLLLFSLVGNVGTGLLRIGCGPNGPS